MITVVRARSSSTCASASIYWKQQKPKRQPSKQNKTKKKGKTRQSSPVSWRLTPSFSLSLSLDLSLSLSTSLSLSLSISLSLSHPLSLSLSLNLSLDLCVCVCCFVFCFLLLSLHLFQHEGEAQPQKAKPNAPGGVPKIRPTAQQSNENGTLFPDTDEFEESFGEKRQQRVEQRGKKR